MITSRQLLRLIEWLKSHGISDSLIVDCLEFINQ